MMLALHRHWLRRFAPGVALLICLHVAPAVHAEQSDTADDAQEFRSVSGAEQEDTPGGPLLVAAYALLLICIASYVLRLARLQRRSRERLDRLQQLHAGEAQK
jgi:hypothetical protein